MPFVIFQSLVFGAADVVPNPKFAAGRAAKSVIPIWFWFEPCLTDKAVPRPAWAIEGPAGVNGTPYASRMRRQDPCLIRTTQNRRPIVLYSATAHILAGRIEWKGRSLLTRFLAGGGTQYVKTSLAG